MSLDKHKDNTRSSDNTRHDRDTVKRGDPLWRPIFFSAAFVYMELLFHIAIYHGVDSNILHPLTFGTELQMRSRHIPYGGFSRSTI